MNLVFWSCHISSAVAKAIKLLGFLVSLLLEQTSENHYTCLWFAPTSVTRVILGSTVLHKRYEVVKEYRYMYLKITEHLKTYKDIKLTTSQ